MFRGNSILGIYYEVLMKLDFETIASLIGALLEVIALALILFALSCEIVYFTWLIGG
jgi:hypothetical protein